MLAATLGSRSVVAVVVAAALLSGCAEETGAGTPAPPPASTGATEGTSTTAPGPTGAGSGEPGTTASPSLRTLAITVEGTRVDPPPGLVDLATGETLRLVVTADAGEAVHAHGLGGVEVALTPGQPTRVDLVGGEPGRYEVELHEPDLLLLQVAVR